MTISTTDKLSNLAQELPPYGLLHNSWIRSDAAKIICDASLTILIVNEETPYMFRCHASDLINKKVHMLLPDALQDRHEKIHTAGYVDRPRDRPMGAGGVLKGKHQDDGSEFPVVIHLIRYRDKDKGLLIEATIRHANGQPKDEE